jgi:uncharacterized protein YycO
MPLDILAFEGLSLPSKLIMKRTWGDYSHVAIMNSAFRIFEAIFNEGVVVNPINATPHTKGTPVSVFKVDAKYDEAAVLDFLHRQVGKKYDIRGLIGFAVAKDYQNPRDWFCSELVMAAFAAGGLNLLQAPVHKVSPTTVTWSPYLTKTGEFKTA